MDKKRIELDAAHAAAVAARLRDRREIALRFAIAMVTRNQFDPDERARMTRKAFEYADAFLVEAGVQES